MVDKKQIRKQIFSMRKEMTLEKCMTKSEHIFQKVISDPLYVNSRQILCYVSYKKEVSTLDLIRHAFSQNKEVLVPKVLGDQMIFVKISSLSELRPGVMNIPEPVNETEAVLSDSLCMIMPGVAFDRNLHRIGYGGGYYDKYLEKHKDIPKIALAFDFQILDFIPSEETDMKPDRIITDRNIY